MSEPTGDGSRNVCFRLASFSTRYFIDIQASPPEPDMDGGSCRGKDAEGCLVLQSDLFIARFEVRTGVGVERILKDSNQDGLCLIQGTTPGVICQNNFD